MKFQDRDIILIIYYTNGQTYDNIAKVPKKQSNYYIKLY